MFSRDEFIYVERVDARQGDSRYRLAELTGESASVLDAGCAVGYLGEFMRRRWPGRWLAGIEIDQRAADKAKSYYDQLILGSIDDARVWTELDRPVDAMIFGDVLEHTTDPVAVLRMASRKLADGGRIVVSIPNVAYFKMRLRLLAGRFDYEDWGIMDRTHLRFFTLRTGRAMLSEGGFEVAHVESVYAYPAPDGLSRVRRIGFVARAMLRAAVTRLWPTLFAYQFILVGIKPSSATLGDRSQPAATRKAV